MKTDSATREELKAKLRSKQREARAGGKASRQSVEQALLSIDDPAVLDVATRVMREGGSKNPSAFLEKAIQDIKATSQSLDEEEEEEAPPPSPPFLRRGAEEEEDEEAPPPLP